MVNRRCGKVVSPSDGRRTERTGRNFHGKNRINFGYCALILVLFFAGCKSLPVPSESGRDLSAGDVPVFPLEEVAPPAAGVSGETPADSGIAGPDSAGTGVLQEEDSGSLTGTTGESGGFQETDGMEPPEVAVDGEPEDSVSEEPALVFPGQEIRDDQGLIQTGEAEEPDNPVVVVPEEPETDTIGRYTPEETPESDGSVSGTILDTDTVSENTGSVTPETQVPESPVDSGAENIPYEEATTELEDSTEIEEAGPFDGMKDSDIPGIWEDPQPGVIFLPEAEQSVEPFHVNVSMGQNLEVIMPGSGWVYMGQKNDSKDDSGTLTFKGKNVRNEDTVFLFATESPGTLDLEFSRFDVIRDSYDDRIISVEINNDPFSDSVVRWEESEVPDILSSSGNAAVAAAPEEITLETADSASLNRDTDSPVSEEPGLMIAADSGTQDESYKSLDSGSMLDSMEKALADGNVPLVQEIADYYPVAYSIDLDRMWYILGQAYEADTDYRDIKKSLAAYEMVVKAYPFSKYWSKSKDRISYINRYYFNIR